MTPPSGDALSHENLGRMRISRPHQHLPRSQPSFSESDSAVPNHRRGDPRRYRGSANRIRSARICMTAMSGTNRGGALLFTITWTQLPALGDDFIRK
jgi:hypothetical protein